MNKITKQEADYVAYATKQFCYDCNMFRSPTSCSLVNGVISKNGHCKYWKSKARLPVAK